MTAGARPVRAPRGTELTCRGWPQEAAYRMLQNNLDPEVAERPDDLVVYGGTGRAARSWDAFDAMCRTLTTLADDETMLVQSGKPVGVFRTHEWAPRVLIANSNLVPGVGQLGRVPPPRSARPHDVRPDDRRIVDLHRHPGHPAGHVRVLRRDRPPPLRRHARRHDHAHRRSRRDGRGAAAGRHDERRRRAVHRRRPRAHRAAPRDRATSTRSPTRSTTPSLAASAARDERRAAVGRRASATPPSSSRSCSTVGFPADIVTDQTSAHDPLSYVPADLTPEATAEMARTRPDELIRRRARAWPRTAGRWSASSTAAAEVFDYGNSLRAEAQLGGFDRAFDYPGLPARLHPPAVLRGQGTVPLGRALRRPGRHRGHRPGRARGVPRRRRRSHRWIQTGRRTGRVPGSAGTDLLARLRRAAPPRAALQRDGADAASCRRRS